MSIHGADNAAKDWLPDVERNARRRFFPLRPARRQDRRRAPSPSRSPTHRSPITQGLKDFKLTDELYYQMQMMPDVQPLATIEYQGAAWPVAWTRTFGKGRVFHTVPGPS